MARCFAQFFVAFDNKQKLISFEFWMGKSISRVYLLVMKCWECKLNILRLNCGTKDNLCPRVYPWPKSRSCVVWLLSLCGFRQARVWIPADSSACVCSWSLARISLFLEIQNTSVKSNFCSLTMPCASMVFWKDCLCVFSCAWHSQDFKTSLSWHEWYYSLFVCLSVALRQTPLD